MRVTVQTAPLPFSVYVPVSALYKTVGLGFLPNATFIPNFSPAAGTGLAMVLNKSYCPSSPWT